MYGSPHDEIIELKVQRACKSWTGDNFEPGMIWEVPILSFWYATMIYMVHGIKRRFRPRSCPLDNPRTALVWDQKDDLRAGETRRAPSWVLQLLYSEVKSPQDNPLDSYSRFSARYWFRRTTRSLLIYLKGLFQDKMLSERSLFDSTWNEQPWQNAYYVHPTFLSHPTKTDSAVIARMSATTSSRCKIVHRT